MEFIIISGLSGAGKSKVASFLEDIGFYVVDNMPAPLMPKFAELCMAGPGRYDRVALVTDIRGGQTFDGLFDALHELHRMGCAYKILFVEASVETIIKRYKETRRMHPLSSTSRSLDEAVRQERTVLAPVRQRAEYIIDTSALSTAKLRGEVLRLFGDGGSTPAMSVSVISFGFKYGIPIEAIWERYVSEKPRPGYRPLALSYSAQGTYNGERFLDAEQLTRNKLCIYTREKNTGFDRRFLMKRVDGSWKIDAVQERLDGWQRVGL